MPRPKRHTGSKTAFILGLPDVPAKQVAAAAAKVGIKISDSFVHTIRYQARKKGLLPPSSLESRRAGTKTGFVLSMPGASVHEVVAAAKKAGIKFTTNAVYVTRWLENRRSGGTKRGRARSGRRGAGGGAEAKLRRAIAELGLARVRQVLAELESAVR